MIQLKSGYKDAAAYMKKHGNGKVMEDGINEVMNIYTDSKTDCVIPKDVKDLKRIYRQKGIYYLATGVVQPVAYRFTYGCDTRFEKLLKGHSPVAEFENEIFTTFITIFETFNTQKTDIRDFYKRIKTDPHFRKTQKIRIYDLRGIL